MKKREKILLGIFLGILVVFGGGRFIDATFLKPVETGERRIEFLAQSIEQHNVQQARIRSAHAKLAEWTSRSLPPDPSSAATLYQNWLIELDRKANLQDAVVSPNRIVPEGESWFRMPFTIQARSKLDQLCQFLFDFEQAPLLHKITRIDVVSNEHTPNPSLQITIQLEAISLKSAAERSELLPKGTADATHTTMTRTIGDYAALIRGNKFVRGYRRPISIRAARRDAPTVRRRPETGRTRPEAKPKPKVDAAAHVFLIASLISNQKAEAWLYDRLHKRRVDLQEGVDFAVAGIEGTVVSISKHAIVLDLQGITRQLAIGQSLRQMKDL